MPTLMRSTLHAMHDIASDAHAAAEEDVAKIRDFHGHTAPAAAAASALEHELALETDTWALLLLLNGAQEEDATLKRELRNDAARGVHPPRDAPPGPDASDAEAVEALRLRDWEFRSTECIVAWLQQATNSRLDKLAPTASVDRGGTMMGWSQTLEALGGGCIRGQCCEVTSMHPDSNLKMCGDHALRVLRLAGQDNLDEEELTRTLWVLLRAGNVGEAKAMSAGWGQPWRAAAMSGGAVVGAGDEDHGDGDGDDAAEASGTVYSAEQGLWQDMCWQLR